MTYREPKEITSCASCGADVAVYTKRQLVNGEVFCSGCRRIRRNENRRDAGLTARTVKGRMAQASAKADERAAKLAAERRELAAAGFCPDGKTRHDVMVTPTGARICRHCWADC